MPHKKHQTHCSYCKRPLKSKTSLKRFCDSACRVYNHRAVKKRIEMFKSLSEKPSDIPAQIPAITSDKNSDSVDLLLGKLKEKLSK